eukprot:5659861-Prymnesium_polylepis.1
MTRRRARCPRRRLWQAIARRASPGRTTSSRARPWAEARGVGGQSPPASSRHSALHQPDRRRAAEPGVAGVPAPAGGSGISGTLARREGRGSEEHGPRSGIGHPPLPHARVLAPRCSPAQELRSPSFLVHVG